MFGYQSVSKQKNLTHPGKGSPKKLKTGNFLKTLIALTVLFYSAFGPRAYANAKNDGQFGLDVQYKNFHSRPEAPFVQLRGASAAVSTPAPPAVYGPTISETLPPEGQSGAERPLSGEGQEQARLKRRKIKTLVAMEIAYQVLGMLDAAQTISCVSKPTCSEGNPLLGKKPSVSAILGFKLATGIIHYGAFRRYMKHENYKSAMTFELVSISVQGLICGLNFRYTF